MGIEEGNRLGNTIAKIVVEFIKSHINPDPAAASIPLSAQIQSTQGFNAGGAQGQFSSPQRQRGQGSFGASQGQRGQGFGGAQGQGGAQGFRGAGNQQGFGQAPPAQNFASLS